MISSNQIILTGNLGADPEWYRKDEESAGVVTFNLAENVSRKNEKSGEYEHTHTNWFPIRTFGSLGGRVKGALKKGDRVSVYGRLRTYRYEREDGTMVAAFEVLADEVHTTGILPKASEPQAKVPNGGAAEGKTP